MDGGHTEDGRSQEVVEMEEESHKMLALVGKEERIDIQSYRDENVAVVVDRENSYAVHVGHQRKLSPLHQ